MTERLAEVGARIEGITQLGAVVNAMRGIAAARAQRARSQLAAVDSYAATIARAIGRMLAAGAADSGAPRRPRARPALVLFCAEQGFAGAFSERILDAVAGELAGSALFLVGSRGQAIAAERGIAAGWTCAMPAHSEGVPRLAQRISEALYARLAGGDIDRLDAVYACRHPGHGVVVERRALLPLDPAHFRAVDTAAPALLNLAADALLVGLTGDYLHAELCRAALHGFAAENDARMEAMAAAHGQIERRLTELQGTQRIVRQQEITAEIIELAAGESASRHDGRAG